MNLPHLRTGGFRLDSRGYPWSESDERLRVLELSLNKLVERTKAGDFWAAGFRYTALLLEAVPLATPEFDVARHHLANAIAYCHANEFGAASFELRILRGKLRRL